MKPFVFTFQLFLLLFVFCHQNYYDLWMDLEAFLWRWTSGKQTGNHITGKRNTVAIHNHSIIRVLQRWKQRSRKGEDDSEWETSVMWPFYPNSDLSPNIYSPIWLPFSVEHKRRNLAECLSCSLPCNENQQPPKLQKGQKCSILCQSHTKSE